MYIIYCYGFLLWNLIYELIRERLSLSRDALIIKKVLNLGEGVFIILNNAKVNKNHFV